MRATLAAAVACAILLPGAAGQPVTNLSRLSDLSLIVQPLMPTTEQCGITPDLLSSTVLMRMSGSTVTLKNYNPASLESRPSLQVWIKTILLPIGLCVSSVTLEVKDNGPYLDLHDRKTVYYINELMFQDDILISSTAKDHPEQIRKAVDQLTSDFRAALELERTPLTKP